MLVDCYPGAEAGKPLLTMQWRMALCGQGFDQARTSVVPGIGILGPWITKAHNQADGVAHGATCT